MSVKATIPAETQINPDIARVPEIIGTVPFKCIVNRCTLGQEGRAEHTLMGDMFIRVQLQNNALVYVTLSVPSTLSMAATGAVVVSDNIGPLSQPRWSQTSDALRICLCDRFNKLEVYNVNFIDTKEGKLCQEILGKGGAMWVQELVRARLPRTLVEAFSDREEEIGLPVSEEQAAIKIAKEKSLKVTTAAALLEAEPAATETTTPDEIVTEMEEIRVKLSEEAEKADMFATTVSEAAFKIPDASIKAEKDLIDEADHNAKWNKNNEASAVTLTEDMADLTDDPQKTKKARGLKASKIVSTKNRRRDHAALPTMLEKTKTSTTTRRRGDDDAEREDGKTDYHQANMFSLSNHTIVFSVDTAALESTVVEL
jgi:hypothetical protein